MKKIKTSHVPQNSKISDFFSKVPNNQPIKNGMCENKRKLIDLKQSPESVVLNSVTNLPPKCNQSTSPNCKKIKCDENCFPSGTDHFATNAIKTEPSSSQSSDLINFSNSHIDNAFKVVTPEKCLKPSLSMKTPTPKKHFELGNKKPQSSKKQTPCKKLYEKSPRKLEEFNVQIIKDFVKVSPSTSNKIIKVKETPDKVYPNHVQSSIVQYISPSTSKRRTPLQNANETTPKSPKIMSKSISPKIRTKLNFSENVGTPSSNLSSSSNLQEDVEPSLDAFLDADFDIILEQFDNLNLGEPTHCKILEVRQLDNKTVLKLKSKKSGKIGLCNVEEFWSSSNYFRERDKIYVCAEKNENSEWVVNNKVGWLVYEPNLLISCTTVVGSLFCKRKSVLSDRFRGFDSSNRVMIIGILSHMLLQQALKQRLKSIREIEAALKKILHSKDTVKRLYESNLTYNEIESELQTFIPKLMTFIEEYLSDSPINRPRPHNWQGKICEIDDIEENLWCPELGIKGKIDVTTRTESGITPLEVKSGRATMSLEHRGQVILYIMMMNKFGYQVSSGLLLYLREGVLKEIKATNQEKRDVMILRNELAYFLKRATENNDIGANMKPPELPEPIQNHRACGNCSYNIICTSLLKFENHDISNNKAIKEVQKDVTSHLKQTHLDYFLLWNNLLSMEAECNKDSKEMKEIYTSEPSKREAKGRCITNVRVVFVGNERNGLFEHTFEKEKSRIGHNLTECDIVENNYVIVSTDSRAAIASGFVTEISSSRITITLDRNLNIKYQNTLFHLDTYDSNNTFSFNLASLARLLENTPRAAELRDVIIDKAPPSFVSKLPSVVAKKGSAILRRLNHVQQRAVLKALCAQQFLLIKGMPGTGKTATIVALIQLLVELDKTVLITSHTHSAIDNICTRLQKFKVDFIRLGSQSKIADNLKPHSEASLTEKCTTPEEMDKVYNSFKVIAVTCLGSGHPLLSKRTVDVCVVDESTQVLQTSIIRPLYAAKTFVLIGDPDQLAPLVRNRDALNAGMSESLFERLSSSEGIITLNLNYRMNKTLTDLANTLTYEGQLQTGNEVVANRTLHIPNIQAVKNSYKQHQWLVEALDTSLEAAVKFIDTGPVWSLSQTSSKNIKSKDTPDSKNYVNVHEATIVFKLVEALIEGGVPNCDIGVIATYRAQVLHISTLLSKFTVDVSTVDQFQGRDKNVVIYSCTKSADMTRAAPESQSFELLEDKRRLTVAITRAKRKLVIVGDLITLQNYKTFSVILRALENNIVKFDSEWNLLDSS